MSKLLLYTLQVNVYLVLFYLLFLLVMRSTTFHKLNRWFLLSGSCLSFLLPMLNFSQYTFIASSQIQIVFDGFDTTLQHWQAVEQSAMKDSMKLFTIENILFAIYASVVILLIRRFVKGIASIWQLKCKAIKNEQSDISFLTGEAVKQPFTFLRWIFIPGNKALCLSDERILKHEKAHADQWHTIDLLFIEVIQIFLWFNPIIILIKQSLQQVHEYLADAKAVELDKEKSEYLKLLASQSYLHGVTGMASQFNCITVKNRIKMITKDSTKKGYQFAYLIVIPVLIMAVFAFSNAPVQQSGSSSKTEGYIPDMKPLAEKDIDRISSGWGMRKHPITKEMKMHSAVDFVAQKGTPVRATANGKVIRISFKEKGKGYGRYVVVSHGKTYATLYSQLSEFKVETGQMLKKGDIVGLVGSSGISTGPHLHYEVRKHGEAVNPADYFNKK